MNLKKTAQLVGLAALLCLGACNSGDSAEEHLARANEFIANSDYTAAVIELKNALQLDGQSAEARYLLGTAYLESGDILSAEKELRRAQQLGWPETDIQPALAQILLAQGEYTQVRDMAFTGLSPEAETKLLAIQAAAAMGQGDSWNAEALLEKALANDPDSADALLAKARLLASQEDLAGADQALDTVLANNPQQSKAWSLRGDLLAFRQDYTGALEAYDKAIEFQRNNSLDLFKRGMLYLQLGNYEAAQADATALLAIAPNHPGPNYLQGLIYYQAEKYGDAITALSSAEPAFQQYPLVLFFLASAQLVEGNIDQAASLAGRFHTMAPDSIRGRKLLATIRLQQGKYETVQSLLQPVLAADPDDVDALNLTANALLREGKTDEGINLLSRVASLQPDSPVAQVRLGAGLLMGGQGDDASQHMETALKLNPEFQQADILLVLNHMEKKDYPAAIKAAKAYQQRHLTSVTPYNLLGKVYLEAGQPEEARAEFQRALSLEKSDPAANHNLAQMAIADGNLAIARGYYETILEEHTDSVASLIQLAILDAREGNEEQLVAHLQQAMTADPNALQPRLLLARYYLGKGRPEQVAPLFTNLEAEQRQVPEVLQLLAMAQLAGKEPGAAQFTLEQLLESTPDSAPVRHMMAMAAAGAGDTRRAKKELQRAVALDEAYVPSRIALARLALMNGAKPEFEEQLGVLNSLAPENPEVLLLLAVSEQGKGNNAAALGFAEKAFALAPSSATVTAVAGYQEASGDRDGALERYATWLKQHPDDIPVRMALANNLQIGQQFAAAGAQYTLVLEAEPDNVIALNNQAWILREQNPSQALEYARRASTLVPESSDVLDTLAVVEYLNKDYPRARRSIERALKLNPDHPTMLYHSAMINAALDDKAAARETLQRLLARNPDFPEIAEAKALLAQLGN